MLPTSVGEAMVAAGRPRRYPRGSLVVAEGDEGHDVLIVRSGAVKVVTVAANGREVVLDVVHAGAILGELSAIDGGPRSASAFALEPTEVLAVSRSSFEALIDRHPQVPRALMAVVGCRLREANRRQLEFGANDALGRVCQRLIELRHRYGTVDALGMPVVHMPFSQSDLANWAGLSREAVVKGLRALRALGWIESNGKMVTVVDEGALLRRAAQS